MKKILQLMLASVLCLSVVEAQSAGTEARAMRGGVVTVMMTNIPAEDSATINRQYTVDRRDGTINMPYLSSRVHVDGLTSRAVENLLTKLYVSQEIYSGPVVQTDVTSEDVKGNIMQRFIHVTGRVGTKKNLPYREGITVIEALVDCGDITDFGSRNIQITRKGVTKTYDYFSAKDRAIVLHPGDMIFVPERSMLEGRPKSIGP
ncbi:MAG: polysaccharide biosynthesis/export family protein [Akkermansia sp.]